MVVISLQIELGLVILKKDQWYLKKEQVAFWTKYDRLHACNYYNYHSKIIFQVRSEN